jgi:hypothetical protein
MGSRAWGESRPEPQGRVSACGHHSPAVPGAHSEGTPAGRPGIAAAIEWERGKGAEGGGRGGRIRWGGTR